MSLNHFTGKDPLFSKGEGDVGWNPPSLLDTVTGV